ncbi:MAG TPA: SIS domain-containing protein [Blastocatellia bacterium]|nr:SIS domain-containing protein [Blastocatellia bacterium]
MTIQNALERILAMPERDLRAQGLAATPREIRQQPATWRDTRTRVANARDELIEFLAAAGVGTGVTEQTAVTLVGAGSSDYVGRALVHLLRRAWRTHVEAIPSTDLLTNMDDLVSADRPGLWISFSRSGDSPEAVAVVDAALERFPRVHHLLVTCNAEGRIVADFGDRPNVARVVLADAVNDRGLAMTSSFTNMVVAGQCLAHLDDLDAFTEVVERESRAAEALLEHETDSIARLVAEGCSQVVFLGTGPLAAVARESALKVVELTAGSVASWSETFLGVRHGPLSAIDDETLVVGFVSTDPTCRSYETDLFAELRRKGIGRLAAVAPASAAAELGTVVDTVISIGGDADIPDLYRPPVDTIIGQLFGLFASIACGLEPDTPSPNGAISRVVSGVRIHR